MDRDITVFRNLLLWLFSTHKKPWEMDDDVLNRIGGKLQRIYASLRNERELEQSLPAQERVRSEFPRNQYLYLNPIRERNTLIPVLSVKSDFGRWPPEVRIRMGLFLEYEHELKAIGYRFEAPEGPGREGPGEHHYYHAQLIHGFEKDKPFTEANRNDWRSGQCPTFPVDADNPVSLLLSLLVALYGLNYVLGQVKRDVDGVQDYLNAMRITKFGQLEWYFRVEIGPKGRMTEYYSTPHPVEFQTHIKQKYPKCNATGITKEDYEQSQSSRRKQWKKQS
jgi:hypothetical protein